MAILPDDTALGGLPSGNSGRPIASYDTSAIGAGISELGKGMRQATNEIAVVQQDAQRKLDELDIAKANSDYLIKTSNIRDEMSDETDPKALAGNYVPKFQQAQADSAALISNPRARELWLTRTAPQTNTHILAVGDQQFKLETSQGIASAQDDLDKLRNAALKSSDPAQQAAFIKAGQERIATLKDAGYIDAVTEQKYRTKWTQDYAIGRVQLMAPEDQVKTLSPTVQGRDAILDRIGGIENATGNPAARSSTSSAMGNFQFTNGTWLDTIQAHRPDLLQGRDTKDVLALRADPKLSREMAGYLLDDNSAVLRSQGIAATPSNLYLAHFLGVGDAAKVLKAAPGTPISDVVDPKSIAANKSVLEGKTVDTVAQWASSKMGGSPTGKGGLIDFIPEDKRVEMLHAANEQVAANGIDGQRRSQIEVQQAKDKSDAAEIAYMQDLESDNPKTTALAITKDAAANGGSLSREAVERLVVRAHARLADANSKADKTYGAGFYDAYQKVHAPDGTPGKITDPAELYSRVGPKGDLTVAGVDKLVTEIQNKKTPEGDADAAIQKQFFANAKAKISGQDEGLHIKDPKGEQLFAKFLPYAYNALAEGKKSGKSTAQLLTPGSPDYIGKVLETPGNGFVRPMDQWFSDVIQDGGPANTSATAEPAFDIKSVKSLDALIAAYRSGQVTKAQADQKAIDNGWAAKRPAVTPSLVPVSQ